MKKIMMVKYGFERCQDEDFNDDGNRFTGYKVGTRVIVSKLVSNGRAYISGRIYGNILPYEEYKKLPHYKAMDNLNGIALDLLTEEDLVQFYNDCLAYEQEYTNAEQTIELPSLAEIEAQGLRVLNKKRENLEEIEQLIKEHILDIMSFVSDYNWKTIKSYYNHLKQDVDAFEPTTYAKSILGTRTSVDFCKPDSSALKDSYYYTRLKEIILTKN